MSSLPGLFVLGEANFSEHGANRLGANALLQGLVDGYFILPITLGNYLANSELRPVNQNHTQFQGARQKVDSFIQKLLNIKGNTLADEIHEKLGKMMWNACSMSRNKEKLTQALKKIPQIKEEFWNNLKIPQTPYTLNQELEKAARIADYIELAELMCHDALTREESCGSHFREEYQTENGDPKRNDNEYCHIACWKYVNENSKPERIIEKLEFEYCKPSQRDYR
jgi:succinate dehydrogenase / fumarate reductase flavoprotein subunit